MLVEIISKRKYIKALTKHPSVLFQSFQFQIIIVEFGSVAFSTTNLTLTQWAWCLFFGFGTLVWQQLVTTIPTSCIPDALS